MLEKFTLKTARDIKGFSQKEAAKLLGVSDDTLSNWERGKTHPDVLYLKKIEKLYGIEYRQIIFLQSNNG